jgi:hypothetical protein
MTGQVKGVPEGASVVIPRLFCRDPGAEIDFCKTTFDAAELGRRNDAKGNVAQRMARLQAKEGSAGGGDVKRTIV